MAKKSEKGKWLDKMRARMRALEKKGFKIASLQAKVEGIEGITLTEKSFTVEGELTEEIKTAAEAAIKTATEMMKDVKSEAYNVEDPSSASDKELIAAKESREFMESYMNEYFKKYYELVGSTAPEMTSKRKKAAKMLKKIGGLLHDSKYASAKEEIGKLKALMDGEEES